MAVTACFAEGTTKLVNVPQIRKKETDRIVMAMSLAGMAMNVTFPEYVQLMTQLGANLNMQ